MARLNVGSGRVSFVSDEYRGSTARVDRGNGWVDVSVSNGVSYMGLYISPADARRMAEALSLSADAIDAENER